MEGTLNNAPGAAELGRLKHDIKNQLSNIHLALEGLRYEAEDAGGDWELYMESMKASAKKIDQLLEIIQVDN